MNSFSAFAAPLGATPALTSSFRGTAVCSHSRHPAQAVRMTLAGDKRAFSSRLNSDEENRRIRKDSEYRGPQGFTAYAERVNGRLAQLGFVIGLVTELASGKPMGEQILIMFSPLVHAAAELTVLSANAAHRDRSGRENTNVISSIADSLSDFDVRQIYRTKENGVALSTQCTKDRIKLVGALE
eukprot:IDg5746t1